MASPTTTGQFWLGRYVQLPQTNSPSYYYDGVVPDPVVVVKEKITSLFSKLDTSSILRGVLQFWAPVTSCSGRRLLTTCNQPVSYNQQDSFVHRYKTYRLKSRRYGYRIDNDDDDDDDDDMSDQEVERESLMIITGPTANAFVNHIAEAVMDISVDEFQGCPLMSSALECDLKSYFVLPVFCPTTSSCVGVVECSMLLDVGYIQTFIQLTYVLESVGLRTFYVQESPPYKTIPALKCSINEIEEALGFVGEAHDLTAAQVWVPYNFVNHVNSSLEVTHAVKLTGYCVDLDDYKLAVI